MNIRVDLICEYGHLIEDVIVQSNAKKRILYPRCHYTSANGDICDAKTEQSYNNRAVSEGYAVVNGANW